jgi:excisionase family DNA binding protein
MTLQAIDEPDDLEPDAFVPVSVIAHHYGVTERFVRSAIATGDLPAVKIGRRMLRVRRSDVDALVSPVER